MYPAVEHDSSGRDDAYVPCRCPSQCITKIDNLVAIFHQLTGRFEIHLVIFLGPLGVGLAIDLGGGREEPVAWIWAFAVMALGSVISALAMAWKPKSKT